MSGKKYLHICSINSNGLQQSEKRKRLVEWATQQKCDILLMQETHFTKEIEKKIRNDFPGELCYSHGLSNARGTAIWFKKNLNYKIITQHIDGEGRLLLINVEIDDSIFTIVNVYAPNKTKTRNTFFKSVKSFIDQYCLGQIVIGGDFNDILSQNDTKAKNHKKKFDKPVSNLKSIIKSLKLSDIWRVNNKNITQFTWSKKNYNEATRIDYFLIGAEVKKNCISCDIRPIVIQFTDHNSISLKINLSRNVKGRGYWKLNNSVLQNEDYQKIIIKLIENYKIKAKSAENIDTLWDNFKVEVRDNTIQYCKYKANIKRDDIDVLERELKELNSVRDNSMTNQYISQKIEKIENILGKLYNEKVRGNQIRSRVKWSEEGEKNSAYFLGLEKTRQCKKTITQLYTENKTITQDQEEILNLEVKYYENLYTSINPPEKESKEYIDNTERCKKISEPESNSCEGEITLQECTNAIFKMKLNKAPGLDGLTVEFYRKFWTDIKDLIIQVFCFCHKKGKLTNTQKIGAISLIYKKGDPLSLENYRPITLLNYDVKLIAYVIAQRLKSVLPNIIHNDQKGYIKNRYIGFNIRQIQDVIDYSEKFNVDGAILFLDFTKAFDSLEWSFMLETLKKFGFKNNFIRWIEIMYTDIKGCILNNGWVSRKFSIFRGIRQGCPASALIFVLAVEIMAIKIRENKNLKGMEIKLDGKTCSLKISQLADDATLFVKSPQDIIVAMNIIETFGSYSGLRLNRSKTEGIWLGRLKHSKDKSENINWKNTPIKSLGFYFGYDHKECQKLNIEKQLGKCEKIVANWRKRNLSLLGKIVIVKSLLIPNLTYIASNSVLSKEAVQKFKTLIYNFIWDSKRDRIKRCNLSKDYLEGGLKMTDIDCYLNALKLRWILRLLENTEENWAIIPKYFLNKFGQNLLIFRMNIKKVNNVDKQIINSLPEFYQDLIKTWITVKGGESKTPNNFLEVRKQIIWGNHFIQKNGKSLFFPKWIKDKIIYINDIIDENGYISDNIILSKIKEKKNWIQEIFLIKNAVPRHWQNIIKEEASYKTKVNIGRGQEGLLSIEGKEINCNMSNKEIYKILFKQKEQEKAVGFLIWERIFNKNLTNRFENLFNFIFNFLENNKHKIFRWKLLHCILPCSEMLFKWKIKKDNLCNFCNKKEDYEHLFLSCPYNKEFWEKVKNMLTFVKFSPHILNLENLIIGYKILDESYYAINYILTVILFSIYKANCISNNKEKQIDIFKIFKAEIDEIILLNTFKQKNNTLPIIKKIKLYLDVVKGAHH